MLRKKQLIQRIQTQTGLSYEECKKVVDLFLEEIRKSLIEGVAVRLKGFGKFLLRKKLEGKDEIEVPAFRASRKLYEEVAYCCQDTPDCQCRYCRSAVAA